ncbi:hypothetical protein ACFLQN_04560 [Candidatus Aenigmatarchaeota archaeon]
MKKGISPLIASVFLIVLVVAVASIITTWLTTLVKTTEEDVSDRTGESIECSNADITIDELFISSGSGNAIIINSGFVDNLSLLSSQIINLGGLNFSATNTPVHDFNKGDVVNLYFSDPGINCGTFSKLIITTSCASLTKEYTGNPTCT